MMRDAGYDAAPSMSDVGELLRAYDKQCEIRLKLDDRIYHQRLALRENWEIVEMRRKWMGHPVAFQRYNSLLKRYQKAIAPKPKTSWWNRLWSRDGQRPSEEK